MFVMFMSHQLTVNVYEYVCRYLWNFVSFLYIFIFSLDEWMWMYEWMNEWVVLVKVCMGICVLMFCGFYSVCFYGKLCVVNECSATYCLYV